MVQGLLDALGFHLATPLRAEVSSLVTQGNTLVIRTLTWEDLRQEPNSPPHVDGSALRPFFHATASNSFARHALADLRAALEYPDDTAFYAYRAIETVRQSFVRGDSDTDAARRKSWQALRDALNVDPESLDQARTLARPRRHGETGKPSLGEAQRFQVLTLARDVVQSFVSQLSTSDAAETAVQFPGVHRERSDHMTSPRSAHQGSDHPAARSVCEDRKAGAEITAILGCRQR